MHHAGAADRRVLCIEGQEATIHEYPSAEVRVLASGRITPSGNPDNGAIDLRYGRLLWWARGHVVVNYNLDDPSVIAALDNVLGPSISPEAGSYGAVPEDALAAELCT